MRTAVVNGKRRRVRYCWCGATGRLYRAKRPSGPCGGTGLFECMCGGEFCVCHHHGEIECPGCDACVLVADPGTFELDEEVPDAR